MSLDFIARIVCGISMNFPKLPPICLSIEDVWGMFLATNRSNMNIGTSRFCPICPPLWCRSVRCSGDVCADAWFGRGGRWWSCWGGEVRAWLGLLFYDVLSPLPLFSLTIKNISVYKAILWIMFICVVFFEQWAHIMLQSVCFPIDNPEQLKPQQTLFWDVGSRSTPPRKCM